MAQNEVCSVVVSCFTAADHDGTDRSCVLLYRRLTGFGAPGLGAGCLLDIEVFTTPSVAARYFSGNFRLVKRCTQGHRG